MIRIRLLCDRAGYGFYQEAGTELDMPDAEAKRLISAKQAEPVERVIETAAIDHRTRERRIRKAATV